MLDNDDDDNLLAKRKVGCTQIYSCEQIKYRVNNSIFVCNFSSQKLAISLSISISFKSLNSYHIIVQQKRRISTCTLYRQYAVKLLVVANNLSNISQTISLQKCIQIADILSLLMSHKYHKYHCYQNVKKSLKKRGNFPPIACTFVRHLFARPTTDSWFIGRSLQKLPFITIIGRKLPLQLIKLYFIQGLSLLSKIFNDRYFFYSTLKKHRENVYVIKDLYWQFNLVSKTVNGITQQSWFFPKLINKNTWNLQNVHLKVNSR
jgi:hypothetical protein